MINVEGTIYVACQGNFYTGGPELLHQLVFKLNQLGQDAKMFYYLKSEKNPVHPNLAKYGPSFVETLDDKASNCLIVPEVDTHLLRQYKHIQKVIWWLSVDNYELATSKKTLFLEKLGVYRRFNFNLKSHRRDVKHLCQSYYAQQFLDSKGIDSFYLSDYLSVDIIDGALSQSNQHERKDIVLYNPKKGFEFTKKLIDAAPHYSWVPIENMTPKEVVKLLLTAKVYIDFGYHPGKDRFPREAAISGCCVITGKRGSAANQIDIPIPDTYKFDDKESAIPEIVQKINVCFRDYNNMAKDFDAYRKIIKEEENRFTADIKDIFGV